MSRAEEEVGPPAVSAVPAAKAAPARRTPLKPKPDKAPVSPAASANITGLLIQVHADNLPKYLSRGLFYPVSWETDSGYAENRVRRPDTLSRYPAHLVLASGVLGAFDEQEILVEVLMTPDEEQQLTPALPNGAFFLFAGALPVSRIRRVVFPTVEAKQRFLASRAVFDDVFFPVSLSDAPQVEVATLDDENLAAPPPGDAAPGALLDAYDRLLGLLGFMQNVPLLFAGRSDAPNISAYGRGTLTALALLNEGLDKLTDWRAADSLLRTMLRLDGPTVAPLAGESPRKRLFDELVMRIYAGERISYQWAYDYLRSAVPELAVYAPLFADMQQVGKLPFKHAIQHLRKDVTQSDQNLPLIALVLLGRYGNRERGHSDKQAVRIHLHQDGEASEFEITMLTALLGLYFGYQYMFRDDANLRLPDPVFDARAKEWNRIKFQVERPLDRLLVESVFQFVFHQRRDGRAALSLLRQMPPDAPAVARALPLGYEESVSQVAGHRVPMLRRKPSARLLRLLPSLIPLRHHLIDLLRYRDGAIPVEALAGLLDQIPPDQLAEVEARCLPKPPPSPR